MTVYSRTPSPPPRRTPLGRPSYVKPKPHRSEIRVPPNYSGNTFMPQTTPDGYDVLPGAERSDRPDTPTDALPPRLALPPPAPNERPTPPPPPVFSPEPVPTQSAFLQHFPFGHGLGGEELLLIGLIFLLLNEGAGQTDRGDLDLTVILLGILLFCG